MTALAGVVGAQLDAAFGDDVSRAPDGSAFFVALGTIGVRVDVAPAGDDAEVVEAYAWIAQGLPITPAVGLHLARRNAELRFAALSIDGEDAIILGHALFAEALEGPALARLVRVLAESAEALDAELRSSFA